MKITKAVIIERILKLDPETKGIKKLKLAELKKALAKLERKIPTATVAETFPIAVIAPPVARFAPPVKVVDTRRSVMTGWLLMAAFAVKAMIGPAVKSF